MTIVPYLYGTAQPHKTHLPRWIARRVTPIMVNEGDAVTISIYVNNYQVGSEIIFWWTGGSNLASSGNWERNWHTVMAEVLAKYGCAYRSLSTTSTPKNPGTIGGVITIGAGYKGETMLFTNITRRNRRNNVTNPDGTPGYREAQILFNSIGSAGTPERDKNGTGAIQGGNLVRVFDSSRTPAGIPKLSFRVDGNITRVFEGEQFSVTIATENIIPRTTIRAYATDEGRRALSPSFKTGLRDAARAVGCEATIPKFDPDNPRDYFDGVYITFTDQYSDSNPIKATFDTLANGPEDGSRLCYLITQLTFEGDGAEFDVVTRRGDWVNNVQYSNGDWVVYTNDGGKYIYISDTPTTGQVPTNTTYWRPYETTAATPTSATLTIRSVPPRYWEVRAQVLDTANGKIIAYAINVPAKAPGDSVRLTSTNAPPLFEQRLLDATSTRMRYEGGRLIAGDEVGGEFLFSVPYPTGMSGKHTLLLDDLQTTDSKSWIVISDACAYLAPITLPAIPAKQFGINCAGAEFASGKLPGTIGTDYAYPSVTEMNWYWSKKLPIMRVPVKWERIQLELFGPIGGANNDIGRLDAVINHFEGLGGTVILDVHNYGGNKQGGKIAFDNPITSTAAFCDLWVKVAARYANRRVWFDLMNEPEGDRQGSVRVAEYMQCVVNAIRSRTDALNMILVEGQRFSSAQYWVREGQAAAFDRFYDPANNFCFSPHNYVDGDASGTSAQCVVGSSRLTGITEWATERGFKLWLGEIAGGDYLIPLQDKCQGILTQVYTYVRDQPAWLGLTVWGGGRRWPTNYEFRFDPSNYVDAPDTGCYLAVAPFL